MAFVDLHLHSNKSDGEHDPREVIRLAHAAGLRMVALTDHDTVDGLSCAASEAQRIAESADGFTDIAESEPEAAGGFVNHSGTESPDGFADIQETGPGAGNEKNIPFTFINGIEMTTEDEHEQHILGYFIDSDDENLKAYIVRLLDMRRRRVENVVAYLSERGVPIEGESLVALMNLPYVGRPQIAEIMIAAGYVNSVKDAFDKYLTGTEFRKVPRPKPSAEEAIDVIRRAGGVAVLAHPHSMRLEGGELIGRLKILKGMGLAGMECHYGTYDAQRTKQYSSMARDCGLVVTGGSDFHGGRIKPEIEIGTGKNGMLGFNDIGVADLLRRRCDGLA